MGTFKEPDKLSKARWYNTDFAGFLRFSLQQFNYLQKTRHFLALKL
jgi:hypothetical protein